jgi:hypothetical protein
VTEAEFWDSLCFYQCVRRLKAYNKRYEDMKTLVAWNIMHFSATQGKSVTMSELLHPVKRNFLEEALGVEDGGMERAHG